MFLVVYCNHGCVSAIVVVVNSFKAGNSQSLNSAELPQLVLHARRFSIVQRIQTDLGCVLFSGLCFTVHDHAIVSGSVHGDGRKETHTKCISFFRPHAIPMQYPRILLYIYIIPTHFDFDLSCFNPHTFYHIHARNKLPLQPSRPHAIPTQSPRKCRPPARPTQNGPGEALPHANFGPRVGL